MGTNHSWTLTEVDGRVSSVALDFSGLRRTADALCSLKGGKPAEVRARTLNTDELFEMASSLKWEDLRLFGTSFQMEVWEALFRLRENSPRMLSYSEFASSFGRASAVRAVAHAIGLNPLPVIIPCHRVIPKPSIDEISLIGNRADDTIFKGDDVWIFDSIDFGEYSLGKAVKRELLAREFSYGIPQSR